MSMSTCEKIIVAFDKLSEVDKKCVLDFIRDIRGQARIERTIEEMKVNNITNENIINILSTMPEELLKDIQAYLKLFQDEEETDSIEHDAKRIWSSEDEAMLMNKVLEVIEDTITIQLGKLDDLTYELANTVANVSFKYFMHIYSLRFKYGIIPPPEIVYDSIELDMNMGTIKKQIENLRNLDKNKDPYFYKYIIEILLDKYKYNIKNAFEMPVYLRSIVRIFKKKKVNENPNLINCLNIKQL